MAFLVQSPTGIIDPEGGINLDNVTEELLNGFFCHYEPPTSENAQFKAAQEVRGNPTKYSRRPVAKPILRTPTLHRKNRKPHNNNNNNNNNNKRGGRGGSSQSGHKRDAATVGGGSKSGNSGIGKSVTWRDEQNNNDRSKIEKDVVGCASNYCGLFQQGEGLVDILMTPQERANVAKDKIAQKTKLGTAKTKGNDRDPTRDALASPTSTAFFRGGGEELSSVEGNTTYSKNKRLTSILINRNKSAMEKESIWDSSSVSVATPTSTTSSKGGDDATMDGSTCSNSSSQKRLTPNLTNRGKIDMETESISSAPIQSKRILYDDLGNPIDADEAEEDKFAIFGDEERMSATVDATNPPTNGVGTPTMAEKDSDIALNANNALAFICALPTVALGAATLAAAQAAGAATLAATQAAEAVGYKSPEAPPTSRNPKSFDVVAAPTDTSTTALGENRDDIGVYEPTDYNNPFPGSNRDLNSGLMYKRVRSPPAQPRQATPRRPRGMSERYEDELYEEEEHDSRKMAPQSNVVSSSLLKIPRQSTGTFDHTSTAKFSPGGQIRSRQYDQVLSPSTITGATSNHYERTPEGRRLRPTTSPSRRSDMYSDLTMEEESYIYYQSPQPEQFELDCDDQENRNPGRLLKEEKQLDYNRLPYEQSASGRRSRGVERTNLATVVLEGADEEQLSPREYAERFGRKRWEGYCEPYKKKKTVVRPVPVEVEEEKMDEEAEHLSPRHYAQKCRERRAAVMALTDCEPEQELHHEQREHKRDESGSKVHKSEVTSQSEKSRKSIRSEHSQRRQSSKGRQAVSDPYVEAQRDPTPRYSIDPDGGSQSTVKQNGRNQLPPTPKKDPELFLVEDQSRGSIRREAETPQENFDFNQEGITHERVAKSREALTRQFSPRSMTTDDEIREEVSSVGMASETIRPLYYANSFLQVPPTVIVNENISSEGNTGLEEPSTMSGSDSTLSSKRSNNNSGGASLKKKLDPDVKEAARTKPPPPLSNTHHIHASSSGSTRSKKLWSGWKKTFGKVKKIVQDIDEQRIHPPHFTQTMNVT